MMKILFDNVEHSKKIGKNIAKYRQRAGLTQETVAEMLHIGNEAISRIERGVIIPNAIRLLEFAQIFDCHVSNFFDGQDMVNQQKISQINESIQRLSDTDKLLVLEIVESLVNRLSPNHQIHQ